MGYPRRRATATQPLCIAKWQSRADVTFTSAQPYYSLGARIRLKRSSIACITPNTPRPLRINRLIPVNPRLQFMLSLPREVLEHFNRDIQLSPRLPEARE
jgi:hypothetical protein